MYWTEILVGHLVTCSRLRQHTPILQEMNNEGDVIHEVDGVVIDNNEPWRAGLGGALSLRFSLVVLQRHGEVKNP